MSSGRRLRTILAACIVAVPALLAAADIGSVTPATASIGSQIAVDGSGFGTGKAPKAVLVPQTAGQKTLALKIVPPFSDTHLDVVVKTVKRGQVGAYDLVVTPADKTAPVLTKTGAVTIGYAVISTFTPKAPPGGQFSIDGSLFGAKKGKVLVGGKKTKIVSWTDTQIVAVLHKRTPLGVKPLWVANKVGNTITTLVGITVGD